MRAERLWCSKTHLCPCDITEETAETGNFVNEHTCMIALCAAGCRTFVFCLLIADPRQQSFLFYLGYVCTTGMNSMSRSVHSRTPSRGHLSKDGRRRAAAVWRSQRKREIQVATPPLPYHDAFVSFGIIAVFCLFCSVRSICVSGGETSGQPPESRKGP